MAYASRTGTRRNLDALRAAGWRLLATPACLRSEGFRYGLDNGAWSAHQHGKRLDICAFERAVDGMGRAADWIVCPDVVADAAATLGMAEQWLPRLSKFRVLLAVQDGMTSDDVAPWLGSSVGIFVGGSTEWKLQTLPYWGAVSRDRKCHLHVGRVNTWTRIAACRAAGAHSFDGTSVSRFANTLPLLDAARRQPGIFTEPSPWL